MTKPEHSDLAVSEMTAEEVRDLVANTQFVDGGDVDLDEEEIYLADGTRLTEARAEQMAEEIAREHAAIRSPGRPSLDGSDEGESPRLSVRFPKATKRHLALVADRDGVKEAVIVRRAVDEYLANHG